MNLNEKNRHVEELIDVILLPLNFSKQFCVEDNVAVWLFEKKQPCYQSIEIMDSYQYFMLICVFMGAARKKQSMQGSWGKRKQKIISRQHLWDIITKYRKIFVIL